MLKNRTTSVSSSASARSRARPRVRPTGWGGAASALAIGTVAAVLGALEVSAQEALTLDEEWAWSDFEPTADFTAHTTREMVELAGTLWLRTDRTVHWYDGFRWQRVGPEKGLPDGRVSSIAPIGGGEILAAVGGLVYRGGQDGFSRVPMGEGFTDGWAVSRAVADEDDVIFVTALQRRAARTPHVFRLDGADILDVTGSHRVSEPTGLWTSRDRVVYLVAITGLLSWLGDEWVIDYPWSAGRQRASSFDNGSSESTLVSVGNFLDGWRLYDAEPGKSGTAIDIDGNDRVRSIARTGDGWIIAVHENGRVRAYRGDAWNDVALPTTRRAGVHFTYVDSTGDLWFANEGGLHQYRRSSTRWTAVEYPGLDPRNRINDLLMLPDGELWIATHDGIARWKDGREIDWIREIDGELLGPTTALALDSAGGIWVGAGATYRGAARWSDGTWERLGPEQGWDAGTVHRIYVSSDGAVWFAALGETGGSRLGAGFLRYSGGELERWVDPEGVLAGRAYAFAEGSDGSLWFGSRAGLARWKAGEWAVWTHEQGLGDIEDPLRPQSRVFTLLAAEDGGVWFGHGADAPQGLGRIRADGSIEHEFEVEGLPDNSIKEIARDPQGDIWISTDRGVGRRAGESWAVFGATAGLDPLSAWPLAFYDESVLIGTSRGVRILNRAEERNPAPTIELVAPLTVAGGVVGTRWDVRAYRGELPPGKTAVRYRIDERPWGPWGTASELRVTTDSADLGWGPHTVSLQAKGLHGQTSEPLVVGLLVPFPVVLRPIFILPVGALTALILALGLQVRARRISADKVLRTSERRFRALVESAPDAIAILDVDSRRFTSANKGATTLLGISLSQRSLDTLVELRVEDPEAGEYHPDFETVLERTLAGQSPLFEWVLATPQGEVPVEVRLSRFPGEGKRFVRFSMLDVRDRLEAKEQRRELEERLRQAQRIEAIGQLTGGVAHDFNNLLTVISGNLELLLLDMGEDAPSRELATGALEAADRSSLLTSRLLSFSRKQALHSQPVNVVKLVTGLLDLLERSLGETIAIETEFETDCPAALVDRGQLENALVNLAVNARDAMPEGGTLNVVVESTVIDEAAATGPWEVAPGPFVSVGVSDTGTGMSEETMAKVFDPFFTTKEVGRGSGLGLSMVYGFVRQSGGLVRIRSAPGAGATFELFLPVADGAEIERETSAPRKVLAHGSGETILVVEDEPQVLEFTTRLCTRLGYVTIEATNGPDAMAILEGDVPIDMLLSDVVLPGGINGVELAAVARRLRPGLPILLTSGYADQPVLARADEMPGVGFVSKPFDTTTLADRLRERLEA